MITLTINGKKSEIETPLTVAEYLEQAGLAGRSLAVAVNGAVIRRDSFADTRLEDGDSLEIVRPVGGGAHV